MVCGHLIATFSRADCSVRKMSILRPFLSRAIRQGRLTVVAPDGSCEAFGQPAAGFPEVAIRFTSRKGMRRILLEPRPGAAEAFMDGEMELVEGDSRELIASIQMGRESGGEGVGRYG